MLSFIKPLKTRYRYLTVLLILVLVIFPLTIGTNAINTIEILKDKKSENMIEDFSNDVKYKATDGNSLNMNYSFDIEELLNYLNNLYDEQNNIFHESVEGYPTTIATFEALSILRFLGLDYYKFGSEWQAEEDNIASQLLVEYRDEADSGGYTIIPEFSSPSLEGSFGVVTSLWIMNEIIVGIKLKSKTVSLLDFVYNKTFDKKTLMFHEVGKEPSIKATFQALTILDLIQKIAVNLIPIPDPDYSYDETIARPVNETVYEFMTNYSLNIFNFIDNHWENNSYFYSHKPYQTPIADTWYALQSLKILERFDNLIEEVSLPKDITFYKTPIINWILSLQKATGLTRGGFGFSESATVTETGMSYAILSLLDAINQADHNETLTFVYSSQFLERENRTYTATEKEHIGGFGPNNLTFSEIRQNKLVNIHSTYFAVLTLLLSGDIYNSIELSLKTDHYLNYESINRTDLIIQGERATIDLEFIIYNYKSHGSLELLSTVDNWNLTHIDYIETNPVFRGKSKAEYEVNLQDDTKSNFNWSIGAHKITNRIKIRSLPVIQSPVYYLNSTVFVAYSPIVIFSQTEIKPGDNVSTTIFYQNRSVPSLTTENITDGLVSITLRAPDKQNTSIIEDVPINVTTEAIKFNLNFTKQDLLGTWNLNFILNQPSFELEANVPIEIRDTVVLYNLSSRAIYYPGENMNLNISLKYTNGFFTPKANATLIFNSNKTQSNIFNLTLTYLIENIYTTNGFNCPTRFLYGHYNVSVQLVWNSTLGFELESIYNTSLPVINIGGFPTISNASYKTDYRSEKILESNNNIVYYGETINLSLTIGFKSIFAIHNISKESINVQGGLVNNTTPSSYIQQFAKIQKNETIYISGLINPNLPATIFGTRFQIKCEWNNSYVYLRKPDNSSIHIGYNFTLSGEFEITNVVYSTTTQSNGLYEYALDSTPVFNISFQIVNTNYENIPVPNLKLYSILDLQDSIGALNKTLPGIALGYGANGTLVYIVSIITVNLSPSNYIISIYTSSAISNNLFIGNLLPGFKIVNSFSSKPLIQIHEALIIVSGLLFIILLYLNLKKLR